MDIPDSYLKADIKITTEARHLVFATDEQLRLLGPPQTRVKKQETRNKTV